MKRVIQHIIEEESRKAFALLVPDSWVTNDFTKDYGKDIHIEIFSNYTSTGKTFIVQLKGTSQKIIESTIAIQIEVEILSYYASLDIPVLLVFFSTSEKRFWGIWANSLIYCLNIREGQTTTKIKLNAKHLIGFDFFKELENNFVKEIPWRVQVAFNSNTTFEKAFERRIIRWLEKYYPQSYGINNAHYPFLFNITLTEGDKDLSVDLNINTDEITLKRIGKEKLGFITSPIVSPENLQKEEAELLLFITTTFLHFSPRNSLLLLQKIIPLYHGKYKNDITLFQIGDFAIDTNCLLELQQIINVTLQEQLLSDFNCLNLAFFKQKETLENYKANLVRAVEIFPATKDKGTLCYNSGNMYRNQNEFNSAIHYYNLARKLRPDYLNKYYWWHEFAGMLFLSEHYFYAEQFYKRSIELDNESKNLPFTHALHADCLLWQGKYKKAKEGYNVFLKQVVDMGKMPSPYQSMMHDMCNEFIKRGYEGKELNKLLSSKLYRDAYKYKDVGIYNKSLEAYPLNYHSWRELGYLYQNESKFEESFYALKNAALLNEVDKNTWLHCFLMCIKAGFDNFSTLIFSQLIFQFGENILDDINTIVNHSSNATFNEQEKIMVKLFENAKNLKENVIKDIYMPPAMVVRITDEK